MARVATERVKRAAAKAEGKLSSVAPLLLRMLRRSIFGVNREEQKERLGLAELDVLLLKVERGSVKTALADIADTQDKVRDLVAQKAADDAAVAVATIDAALVTALASIETARAASVASMLTMGLSAARNATLTANFLALATAANAAATTEADAAKAAATNAARDSARGGANRVLTRTQNQQEDKLVILDDKISTFKNAIESEGVRLGIRI
jgi:hypothetical protein